MAFMQTPKTASGNGADRVPVLAYDARAGRLSLHDRVQDDAGEWSTVKTDVTRAGPSREGPSFAVDFLRLDVGFIHFADKRPPLYALAPYGEPAVQEPEPPGVNAVTGKPVRYKPGFRVPVLGRDIGGVREFAGNSAAMIAGMNRLHDDYEAAPEARAGKLPLVKLVDTREIRSGQSCNYEPVFEIIDWVHRPENLLGPRTVAPPGAAPAAAPLRTASPATRHAPRDPIAGVHADRLAGSRLSRVQAPRDDMEPPDDRWGDTPPPSSRPAGGASRSARVGF
jgi:hypothetical protein